MAPLGDILHHFGSQCPPHRRRPQQGIPFSALCPTLGVSALLTGVGRNKVSLLQLFAQRYKQDSTLQASGRPVRSRTVEDAVRVVGEAFARMGALDTRLNAFGDVNICLISLYRRAWKKEDAPPERVKSLPISLVRGALRLACAANTPFTLVVADSLIVAFYLLLCPSEYYTGTHRTHANDLFRFQDIGLRIGCG